MSKQEAPPKKAQKEAKPAKPAAKGDKPDKADKAQKSAGSDKGKGPAKSAAVEFKNERLKVFYRDTVTDRLKKEHGYKNPMEVPKIEKIVLNVGVGEASQNNKILDEVVAGLAAITGQRPAITKAKKSIANFKLREGMSIGARVTLRGSKMFVFYDKLVNVVLPRIRDFRGISPKGFDGRGNFTLGLREQIIFPEINYDKVSKVHGMNISIVTTARSDQEARSLLKEMGMPFRDK